MHKELKKPNEEMFEVATKFHTLVVETVADPRQRKKTPHLFGEVVVMAVCAVVCNANHWVEIAQICRNLEPWLRQFLTLPNGIPSHDTFGRIFRLIRPELLSSLMRDWVTQVRETTGEEIEDTCPEREQIAIDGKTSRRSHDRASGKKAMHMISAYSSKTGLVLTCMDVEEKSNEIPAVPEVLDQLDIEGAVITLDAMGCQTETAQTIVDGGADYILSLKGNQGSTHKEVKELFDDVKGREREMDDVKITGWRCSEEAHGRETTWEYFLATNICGFQSADKWPSFGGAIKVHRTCIQDGVKSEEDRYYITSMRSGVRSVGKYVRGHWGVENNLHWCLDIAFREDESRIRKDNGPANFSTLRRFAFNMVKRENTLKRGLNGKRLEALLNEEYRNRLLFHA